MSYLLSLGRRIDEGEQFSTGWGEYLESGQLMGATTFAQVLKGSL